MHGPGAEWAAEFSQTQAANSRGAGKAAGTSAEALEQTHALRDTLASSQDPKFRKSKFLQFVSKMSRGEIILEDNQATPPPPPRLDGCSRQTRADVRPTHFCDNFGFSILF